MDIASHSSAVHLSRLPLGPPEASSSPGSTSPAPPASLLRAGPPASKHLGGPPRHLVQFISAFLTLRGPKPGAILQMWSNGLLNQGPQFTSFSCPAVLLSVQPVCCQPSLLQGHMAGSFLARSPTPFSAELPPRFLSMQGVYVPQVQDLMFFLIEFDEAPDRLFLCLTCNLHDLFKSHAWASHHHIRG